MNCDLREIHHGINNSSCYITPEINCFWKEDEFKYIINPDVD